MLSTCFEINGNRRIVRDVRVNDALNFEAYYKGCHIAITEYGVSGESWNWDVRGRDGGYLISTYHHKSSTTRQELLVDSVEMILSIYE